MKNNVTKKMALIGFLLLLLISLFSFAIVGKKSTKKTVAVSANVQFGRGPTCVSRGICSIDEPGESSTGTSGMGQGNAQIHVNANGQPVVEIFKNFISVSTMETQFVNGYFEQLEDVTIPTYFSQQSSTLGNLKINKGSYPVLDLGDRYAISF